MFQVVQPLALFALAGVAIPILIHLRRRRLPVVRVGTLRPFLSHSRPSRARALHDWPRLLLRCAILTALALAFAGLRWMPRRPPPARWCLLLPGTTLRDDPLRDWTHRLGEGFEPHWLSPGFPHILDPNQSPAPEGRLPVWPLLRQADARLPPGSEAWVFSPTWASLFEGNRPSLTNLRVRWSVVPTPAPPQVPPPMPGVGIVHTPDRAADALYLRAALQAMGASPVSNAVPQWLFQLGPASLPFPDEDLQRHAVRIVRDAPDTVPPEFVSRRIEVGSKTVGLWRRVSPGPGAPLSRDSHGEPWLTEERRGRVVVWQVAFRFHPDWTDWPTESAFPAWWRTHLQPDPPVTTAISPEQATPRFVPDARPEVPSVVPSPEPIDLRAGCWGLATLLFLTERLLSGARTRLLAQAAVPPAAAGDS